VVAPVSSQLRKTQQKSVPVQPYMAAVQQQTKEKEVQELAFCIPVKVLLKANAKAVRQPSIHQLSNQMPPSMNG